LSAPKKIRRIICEDYCRDFPDIKDLTLARKIYEENKLNFQNIEQARSFVRIIRGHNGKHHFKHLADKSNVKPLNYDTTNSPRPFKEKIETTAKVLVLDIETAPIRAYVWGIWNQNVSLNQIQSDWFCLTWAAKWLFEDKVYSGKLTPKEVKKQDDKRIIKGVWELLNEADLVIAHNGERFDLPKLNARFIINDLHPPLPYQSIDTLKHIRRQFGFTSNKLDYVNKLLNLERKTDTGGFELWERCMLGEQAALDEMEGYNINDVRILEETYLHIRPWIKPHPNMGLFILDENQHRCPSCGSADLIESGKGYYTTVNIYAALRCNNCGATARKRVAEVNIKQRRFVLQSSPK
jgi:DNA polymerase elongation subunit (family B)